MAFSQLGRSAKLYVSVVIAAGTVAVAQSLYSLSTTTTVDYRWLLLAALTLISGSANVKLASVAATISVSETFVFTSVILFGAGPGTLIVALDAFVVSIWVAIQNREVYRLFFNIAAPSISIWIAAQSFFLLLGRGPLTAAGPDVRVLQIAGPLLAFTLLYFLLNSWLISFAIALKERVSAVEVWRDNMVWLSLNYFGGASVAALLVGYKSTLDVGLLLVIAPILLVLYFTFKTAMGRVEDANKHLAEVNKLLFSTIETLAMAIDAKDQVTHGHIRRVQTFAVELAKVLGVREDDQIRAIEAAALLHDMGKLAVPEHILNKPGPLNESEIVRMRTHAAIGADILSSINFPYPVVPIVRHHHENWDGTGYPAGLKGTEIPVGARVLSVVDCFDALTSDRPYRPKLSTEEALEILQARRGKMYDPLVVDAFVGMLERLPPEPQHIGVSAVIGALTRASLPREKAQEVIPTRLLDAAQLSLNELVRKGKTRLAIFFLSDHDATSLRAAVIAGTSVGALSDLEIHVGDRLSGWVAANGRPIVNSDAALDLGQDLATQLQLGNAVSVPARSGEPGPVAVVTAYSRKGTCFSSADTLQIAQSAKYLEALVGTPLSP